MSLHGRRECRALTPHMQHGTSWICTLIAYHASHFICIGVCTPFTDLGSLPGTCLQLLCIPQASPFGIQHKVPGARLPGERSSHPAGPDPDAVLVLGKASGTAGPKRVKRAYRATLVPVLPKAPPRQAASSPAAADAGPVQKPCADQHADSHVSTLDAQGDRQSGAQAAHQRDCPQPAASEQQVRQPSPAAPEPVTADATQPQHKDQVIIPPDAHAMQYYMPISERVKRQRKPPSAVAKPPLPAPVQSRPRPRQQQKGHKGSKAPAAKPKGNQATTPARSATPEPAPQLKPKASAAQKRQGEEVQTATCARGRAWVPGQQGWGRAEGPGSPKRAKIRAEVSLHRHAGGSVSACSRSGRQLLSARPVWHACRSLPLTQACRDASACDYLITGGVATGMLCTSLLLSRACMHACSLRRRLLLPSPLHFRTGVQHARLVLLVPQPVLTT